MEKLRDEIIKFFNENKMSLSDEMCMALGAATAAMDLRIPKKPEEVNEYADDSFYRLDFLCPSCHTATYGQPYKPNYCKHCGQRLDWEE